MMTECGAIRCAILGVAMLLGSATVPPVTESGEIGGLPVKTLRIEADFGNDEAELKAAILRTLPKS
jgi:hypothetical protein